MENRTVRGQGRARPRAALLFVLSGVALAPLACGDDDSSREPNAAGASGNAGSDGAGAGGIGAGEGGTSEPAGRTSGGSDGGDDGGSPNAGSPPVPVGGSDGGTSPSGGTAGQGTSGAGSGGTSGGAGGEAGTESGGNGPREFCVLGGGPCVYFEVESFESCPPLDWSLTGDWECGAPSTPSLRARSGVNVVATRLAGEYTPNDYEPAVLGTPQIDLAGAGQPILEFYAALNSERDYDGFNVKVRTKSSKTRALAVDPPYPTAELANAEVVWSGDFSALGYRRYLVDLSAFADELVRIEFEFFANEANNFTGVYIDDVSVFDASLFGETLSSPAIPRCETGTERCRGDLVQECSTLGTWQTSDACEFACAAPGGCVGSCEPGLLRCKPGEPSVRQLCDASGTFQDRETCWNGCNAGACQGVYFDESFEAGCDMDLLEWRLTSEWQCGSPSSPGSPPAHGGKNVVGTRLASEYGESLQYASDYAETERIDLSSAIDPKLEFWAYVNTEELWDGFNVWVRRNDEEFQPATEVRPAYDDYVNGELAWFGDHGTYRRFRVDLAEFVGQTVTIRFAMASDDATSGPGVHIDDVSVREATLSPLLITTTEIGNPIATRPFVGALEWDGGSSNATWSIVAATNADFLTIDPNTGTLSGAPLIGDTGPGSVTVRITERDVPANFDEITLDFDVLALARTHDFDDGCPGDWTFTGDWECGTPATPEGPTTAHSGTQCIATQIDSDYSDSQTWVESSATSPPIDLAGATQAVVQFYMWLDTEERTDGVTLLGSTDGAAFEPITEVSPAYDARPDAPPAWTGQEAELGWRLYHADLSAFAGETVQLRFGFESDDSVQRPGAYIDSIAIGR